MFVFMGNRKQFVCRVNVVKIKRKVIIYGDYSLTIFAMAARKFGFKHNAPSFKGNLF